ncbi:protein translocase subunit SecF, partial [bacterium]|nr:protein translocase subunit SecF [bacterium]
MQFLKTTHIHFIKQRKIAAMISGALILISIISLVLHGGPRYGIDFTGGVQLRYHFEQNIDEGNIRDAILNGGIENPTIKKFSTRSGEGTDILIFVQQQAGAGKTAKVIDGSVQIQKSAADMSAEIHSILESAFADQKFEEIQKNMVGPKIGGELRSAAILAILASLLLILIYISWRFEFRFAIGAIIALFHDVVITLGIFSLLNLEITLSIIAAFLTIVGYSLNDTIVV